MQINLHGLSDELIEEIKESKGKFSTEMLMKMIEALPREDFRRAVKIASFLQDQIDKEDEPGVVMGIQLVASQLREITIVAEKQESSACECGYCTLKSKLKERG